VRTVHCPLCGLRYAHASELDCHVREDHAPPAHEEGQETVVRQHRRPVEPGSRRVLRLPW
jgi:hypothetical protein